MGFFKTNSARSSGKLPRSDPSSSVRHVSLSMTFSLRPSHSISIPIKPGSSLVCNTSCNFFMCNPVNSTREIFKTFSELHVFSRGDHTRNLTYHCLLVVDTTILINSKLSIKGNHPTERLYAFKCISKGRIVTHQGIGYFRRVDSIQGFIVKTCVTIINTIETVNDTVLFGDAHLITAYWTTLHVVCNTVDVNHAQTGIRSFNLLRIKLHHTILVREQVFVEKLFVIRDTNNVCRTTVNHADGVLKVGDEITQCHIIIHSRPP